MKKFLLTYYLNSSLPNMYQFKVIDITDQFAQDLTSKGDKVYFFILLLKYHHF
jgi:hypothetical protein